MATGTVNLPPGYQLEAPQAPPAGGASLPPGYQLEDASAAAPVNAGGGAPLTEQDAKQDQANPSGSYAASQAHVNNAPAKDPDHVRFKASDGSVHDVPKEHLTKAMQIDPKLKIIDWPTVPMSKAGQAVAQIDENVTHPDTKAMGAYARMGEEEEQKTGAGPGAAGLLTIGSGGAAADLVGAGGGIAGLAGRTLAEGAGSAAGNAAGQALDKGEVDPKEVALSGILGSAARAVPEVAGGVKSLISGGGKDVIEQGLKDMIKTASGSKDPDVIDMIHSVVDKPKMFSTVENELKLAKPKISEMKDAANAELKNLRKTSTGVVKGSNQAVHDLFDQLTRQADTAMEKDTIKQGINYVREFITPQLKDGDMVFREVNDAKKAAAAEIKKFDPVPGQQQVVNTLDKAKQEALHKVRNLLETLEQQAEPASREVNDRVSTLIETDKALNKKFPTLDTTEKAEASYQAGKTEAKKDLAKKVGIATVGGGLATGVGAGIKSAVDSMTSNK